ncbi:MAG: septum formation initiator family protein [Chloroflexota bacterium]
MTPHTADTPQNNRNVSSPVSTINRRKALGLLVGVLTLALVGWMYLSQASQTVKLERQIRGLRQQKQELQRQNDHLVYEVARLASVERLERRARELGYVAVWQAHFLLVTGYPSPDSTAADEMAALPPARPQERATPSAVAGWWQAVTQQFEAWSQADEP